MSACECCWQARHGFQDDIDGPGAAYYKAMKAHEERGCVCTKDTLEGRRARAGQWWDEEKQIDTRDVKEAPPDA